MLFLLLLWLADPHQATALLQQGLLAMGKGQTTEARTLLEKASQIDGTNAYIWVSLAEVDFRLKQTQQSAAAAEKAEKLGASDPLVCHALAMYYSESNQPGRAAPLEETFAASPHADQAALARAANLYLAAGQNGQALSLARLALQLQDSPAHQGLLGRALLAKGQEQEALPYLREAWEADQSDEDLTFAYVKALLQAQSFTDAADTVTAALKQHPNDVQLELLLGVARYGQRRFDDAISTFLQVIHLDPEVEQPYLFLGRLLEQASSHLPDILGADRAWAAHHPKNPKAQLELAKALLQQNRNNLEAATLLRSSLSLDGRDWEAHYQLGVYLENKHDFAAAAEELQKAAALNPKQALPHYHLARVYDRLGQTGKAESERALHTELSGSPKAPN